MLSKRYIEPIQTKIIFSGIIISVDCKSEFNRIFFIRQNCNLETKLAGGQQRCSHYALVFKKRFIANTVCTACRRTSYKIVRLTNLNKYLNYDTSETEVNVNISANNSSEKLLNKHRSFR